VKLDRQGDMMNLLRSLPITAFALASFAACSCDDSNDTKIDNEKGDGDDAGAPEESSKTILDLADVKSNPDDYEWFDFRPNVKKLILAGAAETEHVAILWYTVSDGGVALHYHSKTESVYVIDGTQTDAKGSYPTGTVYFNPPGSGHQITNSSGFFLLAYAAPPDFMSTDLIGEYTPVRIDTDASDLTSAYPFEEKPSGVQTFAPKLDDMGGMSATFIELASTKSYKFEGNYLAVLEGSCEIDGQKHGADMLVVAETVQPETFKVKAPKGSSCLAMVVSF
jgi:hypothetical protein